MIRLWTSPHCAAGVVLGLCLLSVAGCGSSVTKAQFVTQVRQAFPDKRADVYDGPHGPEGLRQVLGEPDRVEKIGGTTESWTYRLGDGAFVLRIKFRDPVSGSDPPRYTKSTMVRIQPQ